MTSADGGCAHGISLPQTMHHHVRDAIVRVVLATLPSSRVYAEASGRGGHRTINEYMRTVGAGIGHRPDFVIVDWDSSPAGQHCYTVFDIKTVDPAGASHITADHTDTRRSASHLAAARRAAADYAPLPPRTRLVTLSISPYGSFGPGFHSFISELSRRTGGAVPASLYEESTWATPRLGPFARMACSVAARRGLAESLRRWWGPASAVAPGGADGAGARDASGAGA